MSGIIDTLKPDLGMFDSALVVPEWDWFWRDPVHMDLFLCNVNPNYMPDLMTGELPAISGTPADLVLGMTECGRSWFKAVADGNDYALYTTPNISKLSDYPITMFLVGVMDPAGSGTGHVLSLGQTGQILRWHGIVTGADYWVMASRNPSLYQVASSIDSGVLALVTLHLRSSTDREMYVNGVSAATSSGSVPWFTTDRIGLSTTADSTPYGCTRIMDLNFCGVLPFDVTEAQLKQWAGDWFGPIRIDRRVLVAVPGDVVIQLIGAGAARSRGIAKLHVKRTLEAAGVAHSAGSAQLQVKRTLQATGKGHSAGSALLGVRRPLEAIGCGHSRGSAHLQVKRSLQATGRAYSIGRAVLSLTSSGAIALQGMGRSWSAGSAKLNVRRALHGAGYGRGTGEAAIYVKRSLTGIGRGRSSGYARLTVRVPLQGSACGRSQGKAHLTVRRALTATGSATSWAIVQLQVKRSLVATGRGRSWGSAYLRLATMAERVFGGVASSEAVYGGGVDESVVIDGGGVALADGAYGGGVDETEP